ncbi:uncharacterized protein I206_103925 [Kwoniella pini CBS 10737]|uniref:F-box domain-containing protein n=1 Tax=Kwoniella pini CBS 10737 TaxID=1296096 RepID=A0A1B9I3D4_9TREE|nr:uncharacterized protein I206_04502 [Kwoniella pini CBS 10737]OCF49971.1 hypothetical protein I206_04502 [Kwoniella pini CBS 10737]
MINKINVLSHQEHQEVPQPAGLALLFSGYADSAILELIFHLLDLRSKARLLRVSKHCNDIFISSSSLQLSYRQAFHALPASFTDISDDRSSAEKLSSLLETEERLNHLKPSSMKCIHVPNSFVHAFHSGYMLMGECEQKIPLFVGNSQKGYKFDSWSVWKMESNEKEDQVAKSRGAYKVQGHYRWKFDQGEDTFKTMAMCVEDNVIAITRESNEIPCQFATEESTASTIHRVYLHPLLPPKIIETPPKGVFHDIMKHPEARLEFIEIRVPARLHLHRIKVEIVAGGRLGVLLISTHTLCPNWLGFWDWKRGVSLGAITPPSSAPKVDDFTFFGTFAIVTSLRYMRYPVEGSSAALNGHSSAPAKQTESATRKTTRGHKVGQRVKQAEPKRAHRPPQKLKYEWRKSWVGCITVYELPGERKSTQDSTAAFRASSKRRNGPSQRSFWEFWKMAQSEPVCSLLTPTFDGGVEPISSHARSNPIDLIIPMMVGENAITLYQCLISPAKIDDALVRGDRDGVMTYEITGRVNDPIEGYVPLRCQGTINLRFLIAKITMMQSDRISFNGRLSNDRRGQDMLDTMWSDDLSVQRALNRRLGLKNASVIDFDEEGWETDIGEADQAPKAMRYGKGHFKMGRDDADKVNSKKKPSPVLLDSFGRDMCLAGRESKSPQAKYSTIYIPYEEWEGEGFLSLSYLAGPPIAIGTRVIQTDIPWESEGPPSKNPKTIPQTLIIRDYNSNLLHHTESGLRSGRPLGRRLFSPLKDSRSFGQTPSPPLSESEYKRKYPKSELKEMITHQCKLPKPIALPKIIGPTKIKYPKDRSGEEDRLISTSGLFEMDQMNTTNHLQFKESTILFEWDMKRALQGIEFDSNRLALIMVCRIQYEFNLMRPGDTWASS